MAISRVSVSDAVAALLEGKLLAYPTEAVWGLGCNPFQQDAVRALLDIKQRPEAKGLIVVAASLEQIQPYLAEQLSVEQCQQLLPGATPTTWLVPFNEKTVPEWVHGRHDLLAVRISSHPIVKALCNASGMPLISTSANPQGLPSARTAEEVEGYFADTIAICEGECGGALRPSMIKNLLTGDILRE